MKTINLGAIEGLPPVEWAPIADKLDAGSAPAPDAHNARTTWLTTINEDGSPHVTAVGALWGDGACWFQTGAGTRKRRNLARDPRCSLAVSIREPVHTHKAEDEWRTGTGWLERRPRVPPLGLADLFGSGCSSS